MFRDNRRRQVRCSDARRDRQRGRDRLRRVRRARRVARRSGRGSNGTRHPATHAHAPLIGAVAEDGEGDASDRLNEGRDRAEPVEHPGHRSPDGALRRAPHRPHYRNDSGAAGAQLRIGSIEQSLETRRGGSRRRRDHPASVSASRLSRHRCAGRRLAGALTRRTLRRRSQIPRNRGVPSAKRSHRRHRRMRADVSAALRARACLRAVASFESTMTRIERNDRR